MLNNCKENPRAQIRAEVEEKIKRNINPSLWRSSSCAVSFDSIQNHNTSYIIKLIVECDGTIPAESYKHARRLEWYLRDELTLPGLLVSITKL